MCRGRALLKIGRDGESDCPIRHIEVSVDIGRFLAAPFLRETPRGENTTYLAAQHTDSGRQAEPLMEMPSSLVNIKTSVFAVSGMLSVGLGYTLRQIIKQLRGVGRVLRALSSGIAGVRRDALTGLRTIANVPDGAA
jgi:hypothetical protein